MHRAAAPACYALHNYANAAWPSPLALTQLPFGERNLAKRGICLIISSVYSVIS
jgi:hypothetical protein